ncbi:hypothetical protein [Bdellovibrio sp. HCB337]|uniref:hypothetical protein n=1 Tax=Bdellovibrio sp. HCB337 TaxID=3394358 RepID=UPI0039A4812D
MRISALLIVLFSSLQVLAAQPGQHCLIKPLYLESLANKMLKAHQDEKMIFPDSSVIQFEAAGNISSSGTAQDGTFEGIFRPEEDGQFSLTPLPILVVDLKRTRELVYVCAHSSSKNPKENYLILYFMRGYSLGPSTAGSFIGDLLFSSVKVKPVTLSPLGLLPVKKLFSNENGINPLGIFLIPIVITDTIQKGLMNAVSTFSKIGVERITITYDNIELATGVDLIEPAKSLYSKDIPLKK